MSTSRIAMRWLLLALPALAPGRLGAQNIVEVQVSPEAMTLKVGQRQTLFPAAFDGAGNIIPTARFTFVASNPTLIRVQPDGTIIGLKAGVGRVEVRSGSKRAIVVISVTDAGGAPPAEAAPPPAAARGIPPGTVSLAVDPATVFLLPSEAVRLGVHGMKEDGTTTGPVRVAWRSLRPDVATIDTSGLVIALSPGQGTIQASASGGLSVTVPLQVTAAEFAIDGTRLVLSPDDLDSVRAIVPGQERRVLRSGLRWSSTNPAVLQVGPTGGVAAVAPGQAEVVATGYFQERRLPVVVIPAVRFFSLDPHPSTGPLVVPLRSSRMVKVTALAADSSVIKDAPMRWELGDSTIAGFEAATGTITGRSEGTTSLTLSLRGYKPLVWPVQVLEAGLLLEPARIGLRPGEKARIAGRLADDKGKPIGASTPELKWVSSKPEIATVGNDGAIVAGTFGTTTLTATLPWGRSATASVVVVGDVLVTSSRRNATPGIFQFGLAAPDQWDPVLADASPRLQPVRSPDRTRIAFSSAEGGNFDIYVMDPDGSNVRRLTNDPAVDGEPAWTPDGQQIVFTSARGGANQLYIMSADGGDARQLTSSAGGNSSAQVSPDGKRIAFLSSRMKVVDVFMMDLDGRNDHAITATPARETVVRFFPNGDLAWATEGERSGGGSQIFRQPAAGGDPAPIAASPLLIQSFAVSRDGATLAVLGARLTDPARNRAAYVLTLVPLTGGASTPVKLMPDEQLQAVSF